jgi:hypothetical protein
MTQLHYMVKVIYPNFTREKETKKEYWIEISAFTANEKCIEYLIVFFFKETSTPRTPALLKRMMATVQHDNSDTTSIQSSNRQSTKRTMTVDNPDISDSM